jgi:hypothetical protein
MASYQNTQEINCGDYVTQNPVLLIKKESESGISNIPINIDHLQEESKINESNDNDSYAQVPLELVNINHLQEEKNDNIYHSAVSRSIYQLPVSRSIYQLPVSRSIYQLPVSRSIFSSQREFPSNTYRNSIQPPIFEPIPQRASQSSALQLLCVANNNLPHKSLRMMYYEQLRKVSSDNYSSISTSRYVQESSSNHSPRHVQESSSTHSYSHSPRDVQVSNNNYYSGDQSHRHIFELNNHSNSRSRRHIFKLNNHLTRKVRQLITPTSAPDINSYPRNCRCCKHLSHMKVRKCNYYIILTRFGRYCLRKIRMRRLRRLRWIHGELLCMHTKGSYPGGLDYHEMVSYFMSM